MTLEFIKGKHPSQYPNVEDVCLISTDKIEKPQYPIWLTKENFEEIKKIMNW